MDPFLRDSRLLAASPVLARQPFEIQELAVSMASELQRFTKYRVHNIAAVNGSRVVFKGTSCDNNVNCTPLAIKAVKLDLSPPPFGTSSDQMSLEMEIKILRKLSSSNDEASTRTLKNNVVHLLDAFHTNHFLFIVTQWCGGGDLFDYLHQQLKLNHDLSGEAELQKMGSWFGALVSAVALLHKKGFAHRDISPENILLANSHDSEACTAKLHDFGLACSSEYQIRPVGKPMYAAPELMSPMPCYDPQAADVWSLGIVLFSMLSKHVPMNSAHASDIHFKAFKENPASYVDVLLSAQKLDNTMCSDAKDLFLKMTNIDPKGRPTILEVLQHPFVTRHRATSEVKHDVARTRRRRPSLEQAPPVKFAKDRVKIAMNVLFKGSRTKV